MATNPMQKKARNSFILGVLITFIIIMVISRANIFSTTISILIEIVYPVLYAVLGFMLLIKDSIMKYTINKMLHATVTKELTRPDVVYNAFFP